MGAGLGSLPAARARRWGPIEIVWTLVVAVVLVIAALLAVGIGIVVERHFAEFVAESEVGRPGSWRSFEVDGLHTEMPGNPEPLNEDLVDDLPFPVEGGSVEGERTQAVVLRLDTAPPADGVEALLIARGAFGLLGYADGLAPAATPVAVPTPTGVSFDGAFPKPDNGHQTLWRVLVAGDRTFFIAAHGEPAEVSPWYLRMIDRIEVDR